MSLKIFDFLACKRILALNADALAALQAKKLQATIRHAYQNVPYYRRLFDGAGVDPKSIRTRADLERVPMSSKDDLLNAGYDNLIAGNVERSSLISGLTTGSTGKAFTVQRTKADRQRHKFHDLRALIEVGFRPWDKLASYTVRRNSSSKNPQRLLYRVDWFSALQPVEKSAVELSNYNPSILWAYPSSFRALLEFTNGDLGTVCAPRILVTNAEEPDKVVRDACKQLALEHFNFYGTIETGRIAWECRAHKGLHLDIDNVVLEIIPMADRHTEDSPDLGETVITTLNNTAMPFIRYRLGDICRYLEEPCSCGISLPLIDAPVGRTSDIVKLPSGRVLTARGLVVVLHQHCKVRQFMITQTDLRHLKIMLVVDHASPDTLANELSMQVRKHLGEDIEVEVRIVESIKQSGPKNRSFLSLI